MNLVQNQIADSYLFGRKAGEIFHHQVPKPKFNMIKEYLIFHIASGQKAKWRPSHSQFFLLLQTTKDVIIKSASLSAQDQSSIQNSVLQGYSKLTPTFIGFKRHSFCETKTIIRRKFAIDWQKEKMSMQPTDILSVIDRLSIIDALVRPELECVFFASVYQCFNMRIFHSLQVFKCKWQYFIAEKMHFFIVVWDFKLKRILASQRFYQIIILRRIKSNCKGSRFITRIIPLHGTLLYL